MNKYKNVVLIAGGSGLIGKSILKECGDVNNFISIDLIKPKHSKARFYKCDISKYSQLKNLINKLEKLNIKVIGIVNAIHPSRGKNYNYFLNYDISKFEKYIKKHLTSFYVFTLFFFNYFLKNKIKNAKIINLSSIYGVKVPNFKIYKNTNIKSPIEYSICKAGLNIMSEYFAQLSQFKNNKIFIYTVSPVGIFNSKIISKQFLKNYKKFYKAKMLNVDVVAKTILKLIKKNNKTISSNIIIRGGAKI